VLPDALRPGPPGAWDDLATWTGSVIEHDGRWYMLYTGISRADDGLIQRIGLAVSEDLVTWHKHPANPVLEADGRWYELLDLTRWRDQSWRDPWLYHSPGDGAFHALITARAPTGAADGRGVVGHARSTDLMRWHVLPPVTAPGEFAQVEVPQLVQIDGHRNILFSAHAEDHSRQRLAFGSMGPPRHSLRPWARGKALISRGIQSVAIRTRWTRIDLYGIRNTTEYNVKSTRWLRPFIAPISPRDATSAQPILWSQSWVNRDSMLNEPGRG